MENIATFRIRSPDRPAPSKLLYPLHYPGPPHVSVHGPVPDLEGYATPHVKWECLPYFTMGLVNIQPSKKVFAAISHLNSFSNTVQKT